MASAIREKRIMNDVKDILKHPVDGIRIFLSDEIESLYAVIFWNKDTPYEGGIFFFHFLFPYDYPYSPPTVKYITPSNSIRIHPNLYPDGKVCLSILGTFSGPAWTASQTVLSILLSIQSLLDDNPIRNEPAYAFESKDTNRAKQYNNAVMYENIRISLSFTVNEIERIVNDNDTVKYVKNYINSQKSTYIKNITMLRTMYTNENIVTPFYGINIKPSFNLLLSNIYAI